ncbi:MAG: N-acetylglucosamine-6-phosphate deacetylase, partial [Rhodopirellula bahusiensis]
ITVGKDADLVVWSGPPMSTTSRCEQTWIDGRPMFRLDDEAELQSRDQAWRNELIQELLDGKPKSDPDDSSKDDDDESVAERRLMQMAEEDRWLRFDEFCNSRGAQQSAQQNAMSQGTEAVQ